MKILDPIRILETIEKLGARKSIKYAFIGTGCILVVVVPICYAITSVKSRGKSKEQNNASANKQGEIKCTSECKIRGKDQTHAHRMEENAQVHEHHMEEIEAKKKADIEKMEKRDELRKDRDAEKANQPLVGLHLNGIPESYHEAVKSGTVHVSQERSLGFSWLREGYDTGLAGPTDCGKSVFIMQVATALARGRCDVNLSSEWHDIPPMSVVMFSLEQSNHEIREYYDSVIDNLSTIKLYAGSQITPAHIITIIKEELEKAGGLGVVVIIDNYTKLEGQSGIKAMRQFCADLDYLRRLGLEKGKPLTPLKVCHAKSDWKLTNPLTPASVRGDKRNVCFTNNFLYLTYCKLGSDKRVLGFMKLKHGNKEAVSILEFVGTKIDQFRYVGKGGKKDLSEPAEPAEESSGNKGGPGRKSKYGLEEVMVFYNMVQSKKCTYEDVKRDYGISRSAIRKRVYRARIAHGTHG